MRDDEEARLPRVPVEVRRATGDDIEDVLALWCEAREPDRNGRPVPVEQLRPRLLSAMERSEVEVFLARWDSRPAGYVIVRLAPLTLLADTPAMHVEHLFVTPELRKHGIARALLSAVVARAERECAEAVVAGVSPWARETHRFFARLGFTPLVVRRTVATPVLRRRLSGESARGGVEDLLSRRRSLRARARLLHRRESGAAGPASAAGGPHDADVVEEALADVAMDPAALDTATLDAAAIAAAALDAASLDEIALEHRRG
jgi:ribosomal protein S18 acetylase RimI-like enzyme